MGNSEEGIVNEVRSRLRVLDELEAFKDLLPSTMIDRMVSSIGEAHRPAILTIWRASVQERRELEEQIAVTRKAVQAMVKSLGASVLAAGYKASYVPPSSMADVKRLRLEIEDDPKLMRFMKAKSHFCRITRKRS